MTNTNRKFGIEIELFLGQMDGYWHGVGVTSSHNVPINEYDGQQFDWNPRVRRQIDVELVDGWAFHLDGSCGFEVVSPPTNSMDTIKTQVAKLLESGMPISFRRTGLHIHVDAGDYELDNLLTIGRFCRSFDRAIFSYMGKGRQNTEYARFMAMDNKKLQACAASVHRANKVNKGARDTIQRYKALNLDAFGRHGTIEFRYSEGTLDLTKMEAMVHLYVGIVNWCKANMWGSIKMPSKLSEKRLFLLDLVGVPEPFRSKLLSAANIHPVTKKPVEVQIK